MTHFDQRQGRKEVCEARNLRLHWPRADVETEHIRQSTSGRREKASSDTAANTPCGLFASCGPQRVRVCEPLAPGGATGISAVFPDVVSTPCLP